MKEEEKDLFPLFKPLPPFMRFPNGYGYMGVILESKSTGKIQCHFCGELFKNVAKHAWHKHGRMTDEQYRENVGLNKFTPLVCESTSQAIRKNFIDLPEKEKEDRIILLRANNKKVHSENKYVRKSSSPCRVQQLNKTGTCDLQAKAYFWEEYNKLGRIPTGTEMSGRLRNLIYTRFSSYEEALKHWGIGIEEYLDYTEVNNEKAYLARKEKNFFPKYEKDTVINQTKSFYVKNGRLPTWSEAKREGLPGRGVFKRLFGTYRKGELEKIIL